jgi:hypothetical protein
MADADRTPVRQGPGQRPGQGSSLPQTYGRGAPPRSSEGTATLPDILERVLDKGIIIAGDIQINLVDVELLTIKLRLLIASVDRAKSMGINWWESDPTLSSGARGLEEENRELRERLDRLERAIGAGNGEEATTSPEKTRSGRR